MLLVVLKRVYDTGRLRILCGSWCLACLVACAAGGPLLNSDRIRQTFGSYGVDILYSDSTRRVSSLFSGSGAGKVTRTYAVVEFPTNPSAALTAEHERIVAGQSIGETFREAGWKLSKQHLYIGEIEVPATYVEIGELMQLELPETLATHLYLLRVIKDERSYHYATITEIHHPAYLDANALQAIYGEIIFDDSNRDSLHEFIGPPNPRK